MKIGNRQDSKCALCRTSEANKPGCHLVPNFLIHKLFSFDGTGKRDKEISIREALNQAGKNIYYGSQVSIDAIRADHGSDLSDGELQDNDNNLVIDDLFCKECEKRFGILETEYALYYADIAHKTINSRVSYLFWLSVFWRMSVGRMSIFLGGKDEFEIREILNTYITSIKEIKEENGDMGDFGYVIWHTSGIMKGDSGIFGTRAMHSPYIILVNDMVVLLLSNVSSLKKKINIAGWEIDPKSINSYLYDEVLINEISLEDFAKLKRFIIDESYQSGIGEEREKAELFIREHDRTAGYLHSLSEEKKIILEAIFLDSRNPKPKYLVRNARRFQIAEMKYIAAQQKRMTYNLLEDRLLFLFKFDVANYKSDLLREAKKYGDVSLYPFAEKYVPSKFINKTLVEERKRNVKNIIESIYANGYSYEDLMNDNCRSRTGLSTN